MKKKIPISLLQARAYCEHKIFLEYVKKVKPKHPEEMRIGSRRHSALKKEHHQYLKVVNAEGRAGSGAYPIHPIPAIALQLDKKKYKASKIARMLRLEDIPIIGYILDDYYHLNFLTLMKEDIPQVANSLNKIL